MELYAQVLSYAIPGFIGLIIIEAIAAYFMGMKINYGMDVISSLSSGMTNTLKSILGLGIVIISYGWMVEHIALMEIKSTVWLYIIAFIGIDFAAYWSHRFNHVVNLFWNRHIVHHSSEEFNLSCALRQSISDIVSIYFFLYIPLALIGVPAEVIAITAPLHLFAQFWYHTRLVDRMGFLEHILVTPSHHRVHHAINPEYIDKNYAAIFIVWDKWFGTFQEEMPDVPPVYGTKSPARTWNPILINFMHVWSIAKDAWRTSNWWDKLRIWFMPTGWRPQDVQEKYPVYYIDDVYQQKKYRPSAPMMLQIWSWVQLIINNLLLYYILVKIGDYPFTDILLYCIFLFVSIFAYTALMDRHQYAVPAELIKLAMGIFLVYRMEGWFGMDAWFSGATITVVAYMVISLATTVYLTYFEKQTTPEKSQHSSIMNLIIETERLLLRPYTVNDIEAAYQMNLDPEVSRYTGDGGVHSLEEIDTIIRTHVLGDYQKHGFGRMAVVWKETNEYIGFSGLKYLPEFDVVDIGYRFKSAFWGRGIATEANLPFIDYGFKTLKLNKIIGMAFPENKASVRVLEKLGLRFKKWIEEDGETLAWYEIQNPLGLSS